MPKAIAFRYAWAVAASVGLLLVAPTPAAAKVGDRAWSQCIWNQAPQSAQAWLSMPLPTWQSNFTEPNLLLGHKLVALCDNGVADPRKPGRTPNWKSVAAALRRERPSSAPIADSAAADILLCQSSIDRNGRSVTFLYEIVRRNGAHESAAFSQYYGEVQGQAVKLPQDLRVQPPASAPISRSCQLIGPNGELQAARTAVERG